ncbi:MAG: RidA family protein [Rhodospirillales bacterium]|jgi:enamine deaminase RidA (YjgF/YER057c/UK114 family)|nr:RidA family protein [Rhodospirillales bacterium]
MTRKLISSGSSFEELAGYSRAVVDGEWVFVSGTTGFDYAAGVISDDVTEQTEQIFRNLTDALAKADAKLTDVVRVRVFVADRDDFMAVAKVLGKQFRDIRPTNTSVVCDLVDERMKVEIEVTARKSENSV